jgi:[acyl-carrier-protein] S-malonyltransferase
MLNKLALVFPGQGSQYLGMGHDLYQRYPEARAVFDEADQSLGLDLSRLCFEGPEEDLNDTVNTQPAILTMSMATLQALKARRGVPEIAFAAGHSLGEYSALVASDHISFAHAARLVRERGRLMKKAGEDRPGGMAAVLGLEAEVVDEACQQASEETGTVVQMANYNSPGQVVISGEERGLEKAMELARHKGARRVVTLAVSIASHSPLMEPAAQGLRQAMESVVFQETEVPVVANVTGKPVRSPEQIREELVRQLVLPVQWVRSVRYMVNHGVTTFAEIGPQDVLSKLIKRIDPGVQRINVGDVPAVEAWRDTKAEV